MSHAEEQADEIEALESIFPETIDVRSPTEVRLSGNADGGEFADVSYSATFVLAVEFTAEYPEAAPEARLIECTGYLENNAEALSTLNKIISEAVEENIGMPMVFSIHSAVQDQLEEMLNTAKTAAETAREEKRQAEIDAEIARYTAGTLCTPETFAEWKVAFEAEMEDARSALRQASRTTVDGKLTGRQLFEQKKVKADSESGHTQKNEVIVDTSVFEGLDFDDLDIEGAGGDAAAAVAAS